MATGHVLPGFGPHISGLRRVQSAGLPGVMDTTRLHIQRKALTGHGLDSTRFQRIRENAKNEWSRPNMYQTTYDNTHYEKVLDEPTRQRPCSPTRTNKPHPPLVFLECRLHHVEGFHNPDAALGKNIYRPDGAVTAGERSFRRGYRSKFIGRPSTAAVAQYSDMEISPQELQHQPSEAWLAQSNQRTGRHAQAALENMEQANQQSFKEGVVPSLHRFMRMAGAEEREAMNKLVGRLGGVEPNVRKDPNMMIPHLSMDAQGTRRHDDINGARRVTYRYKPLRGDFLIHPDYPPTLKHHRLPDWPQPDPYSS